MVKEPLSNFWYCLHVGLNDLNFAAFDEMSKDERYAVYAKWMSEHEPSTSLFSIVPSTTPGIVTYSTLRNNKTGAEIALVGWVERIVAYIDANPGVTVGELVAEFEARQFTPFDAYKIRNVQRIMKSLIEWGAVVADGDTYHAAQL